MTALWLREAGICHFEAGRPWQSRGLEIPVGHGWLLAKEYSSCRRVRLFAGNEIETESENSVDGEQQHTLEPVRLTIAHDLTADAHRQYYGQ
jgi:hypothetical protein